MISESLSEMQILWLNLLLEISLIALVILMEILSGAVLRKMVSLIVVVCYQYGQIFYRYVEYNKTVC